MKQIIPDKVNNMPITSICRTACFHAALMVLTPVSSLKKIRTRLQNKNSRIRLPNSNSKINPSSKEIQEIWTTSSTKSQTWLPTVLSAQNRKVSSPALPTSIHQIHLPFKCKHPSILTFLPTGPLSAIGDPLGQALSYGLKPLGHVTGAIGNPNGQALLNVRKQAEFEGKYTDDDNGKPDRLLPGGERIGGKEQTGENPLGL